MGHTVINIFRIVFYVYLCDTNQLRLKTALLQLPVIRFEHYHKILPYLSLFRRLIASPAVKEMNLVGEH